MINTATRSRSVNGSIRDGISSRSWPVEPSTSSTRSLTCRGITETRKIATMAEAYDVAVALHCPLGPIALATCQQIDGCTYNAVIQEQSLGIHYNVGNDLLTT
jgi:hypothetical protein